MKYTCINIQSNLISENTAKKEQALLAGVGHFESV